MLPRECPHELPTGIKLPQTFSQENLLVSQASLWEDRELSSISNNSLQNEKMVQTA